MWRLKLRTRLCSAALTLALLTAPVRHSLAVVVPWIGPDQGDWNLPANWEDGVIFGLPNALNDEAAAISNDATAVLTTSASTSIAGLTLGQQANTFGGLRITNGGSLSVVPGVSESGVLAIGAAGQGSVEVRGGGSISAASLSLGGADSSLLLGDASGLAATLSTSGNATLGRTTEITGRFVDFSVGGNLTLNSASTLVGIINDGSTHSPLKSAGTASISGVFRPEFVGVSPAAGATWNLIDATTINGGFSTLDTSVAPVLPVGQTYRLRRSSGGENGQLLQLTVAEVLSLAVDRDTGAVSITNNGTGPITLDGYSIVSSFGALTGTWNSLADQGVSGWLEADPMPASLSEVFPQAGGLTLAAGQSRTLGTPYAASYPGFGLDPDHLEFEYSTPDGETYEAVVEYSGAKINNNLILSVDPATGHAQLKNDSPFAIFIDGYVVYSPSGSLQPVDGDWESLHDQGVTGWDEALPTPTAVSEVNPDGVLTLSPFSGYDLGELFDSQGGTQDLRFEFLMADSESPVDGSVAYGAFGPVSAPGLPGDFNDDGVVDAADYTVWRDNSGAPSEAALNGNGNGINGVDAADYTLWSDNYGLIAAPSSATGVPEPTGALLSVALALLCRCRRPDWS